MEKVLGSEFTCQTMLSQLQSDFNRGIYSKDQIHWKWVAHRVCGFLKTNIGLIHLSEGETDFRKIHTRYYL